MKERPTQGGPERQPLPSVLDVLERQVQLSTTELVQAKSTEKKKYSLAENAHFWEEFREKSRQVREEKRELVEKGTERDRLILVLYEEVARGYLPAYMIHDLTPALFYRFRSRVELLSDEDLPTEIRKAKEATERTKKRSRKIATTKERYKQLSPEERAEERRKKQLENSHSYSKEHPEKKREQQRRAYQRRKEREKLQTEQQQQPTEVFPSPPKK